MVIKSVVFKIFLICSNVLLLCVGLTILILGIKMHVALNALTPGLMEIPFIWNAVNSVMVAGVFIALCSLSGLIGACSELKWLILGHLIFLGMIVILEFSVGVTLMMIKQSVSAAVESADCNNVCAATFDAAILDYALPSAGLMMFIIFVEALMIYSSMRLYFFIKDKPGANAVSELPIVGQNVQMQNVAGTPTAFAQSPQSVYPSLTENSTSRTYTENYVYMSAGVVRRPHIDPEDRPPDYESLAHQPPLYDDVQNATASASASRLLSEDTDVFYQV